MKAYNHNTRGLLYHPNWPVEPIARPKYYPTYLIALEKAIEEAVPYDDQEQVEDLILETLDNETPTGIVDLALKPNTFYECYIWGYSTMSHADIFTLALPVVMLNAIRCA